MARSGAGDRPKLLVIDPAAAWPEEQGVAEVSGDWPGESRVLRPALTPGDGPAPGDGYDADGVVVLGSRASVHDDPPWLGRLGAWVEPLVLGDRELPLLGICFGHQLVAHVAGGEVDFLHGDRSKEAGVRETVLSGSRLVPGARRLRVVVSHREVVKRAPAGFRVVAHRTGVPVDGLEHERRPIFTYQFHPEAGEEFARRAGIAADSIDAGVIADSRPLLAAFRRLVLERAARGSS